VAAAHSLGLRVFADPANTPADWNFFASLGVDAIYSTIPMGVQLQPPIPDLRSRAPGLSSAAGQRFRGSFSKRAEIN
jgi:hypothetical protein